MKKTLFATCVLMASMTASAQFINQEFINQAAEMAVTGNMDSLNSPMQEEYQAESQRQIEVANYNFQEFDARGLSEKNRRVVNMFLQLFNNKQPHEQRCDARRYAETRKNGNMTGIKKLAEMFEQCEKEFPRRKR